MRGGARFRDLTRVVGAGDGALATALSQLDGEARLVLALLLVEGLSEAEAAAALDRSVEHVHSLAGAARSALAAAATGADLRRAA
jgi:DNA-directed RNA polymerase specialized sigma24 family protein